MEVKVFKLKEIETANGILVVGKDTIEPKLPEYGKEGDACMDVYPIYCEYDTNRDRWIYHTGLAFAISDSPMYKYFKKDKSISLGAVDVPNEMELRPRSNLTKSDFYIPNAPGTLDWGYRGELLMVFKNRTNVNLVNSLDYILKAIDKLSMRCGAHGEIRQFTSISRKHLNSVRDSVDNPPYECDGKDRMCQLIIRGTDRIEWVEVDSIDKLGTSERGKGGFGSTGGAVK
jgi:dUTPase